MVGRFDGGGGGGGATVAFCLALPSFPDADADAADADPRPDINPRGIRPFLPLLPTTISSSPSLPIFSLRIFFPEGTKRAEIVYGGERMAGEGSGRGRGKGNKEACLLRLRLAGRGRKGGAGKGSLGTVNFETRSYFSPTAAALFPAGNIAKLPSLWFACLASSRRRPHCGPPDGHSCLLMIAKKGGLANDWKIP